MGQKQSVKFILTTQSEDDVVTFVQITAKERLNNGFFTKFEQLTGSDLTSRSLEELLQKRMKFQDARISLNVLMSPGSSAPTFLPLGTILEENKITIADPVLIKSVYNESCYIDRAKCLQKCIKEDIFIDKTSKDFPAFIASTEQEFRQFCQMNTNSNIHRLEKDKSGKILWHESQGSLETLRRFLIPRVRTHIQLMT